jgi:hypothetical protein
MGEPRVSEDRDRLVPLPVLVSSAQKAAFQRIAAERQTSVGNVVRDVLRDYLASDASRRGQASAAVG